MSVSLFGLLFIFLFFFFVQVSLGGPDMMSCIMNNNEDGEEKKNDSLFSPSGSRILIKR